MDTGTYLLLLRVADKNPKDKNETIQTIDFEIKKQ
jgi:hypothetical protein